MNSVVFVATGKIRNSLEETMVGVHWIMIRVERTVNLITTTGSRQWDWHKQFVSRVRLPRQGVIAGCGWICMQDMFKWRGHCQDMHCTAQIIAGWWANVSSDRGYPNSYDLATDSSPKQYIHRTSWVSLSTSFFPLSFHIVVVPPPSLLSYLCYFFIPFLTSLIIST